MQGNHRKKDAPYNSKWLHCEKELLIANNNVKGANLPKCGLKYSSQLIQ